MAASVAAEEHEEITVKHALRTAGSVLALSVGLIAADIAPASAATSASRYGCTVTPASPYITYYNGVKYAEANVYVRCSDSRSGIVNAQIRESDNGADQHVSSVGSASFSIPAGGTRKVITVRGRCTNFDAIGNEELFTRAMINVGGVNSDWAQTYNVSTSC